MWRHLLRNSGRSLTTISTQFNFILRNGNQKQRFLFCPAALRHIEATPVALFAATDGESDYIVPYKPQYERAVTFADINRSLTKLGLSKEEQEIILSHPIVMKKYRERCVAEVLDVFCKEGILKENLVDYPWLITLDKSKLVSKFELLKSIKGLQDINDFVPFLHLSIPRLSKLINSLNRESRSIEQGNRVYYLAKKLNLPAATVTKYLANRLFVLEMPLDVFETNLNIMIKYKVESMSLLKDLWGFRYSPKCVELRLKRASQAKKGKIMPWMVRCPEPILQKSLQLSLDELKILGGRTSAAEYIGERLGFSTEEAEAIIRKHPQVSKVRVTKIKEVLDYLLDEEKFTRFEVAQVPRVLCHSLETTKERIDELKSYGCRPSSLVIVCRSRREYEKFLEQWLQNSKYNRSDEHVQQEKDEK